MRERPHDGASLFGPSGNRKYLNAVERHRFVAAAWLMSANIRLFCLMLRWTGARISEVLAITPSAIDLDAGAVSIVTLKRRKKGIVRQVPLPRDLLRDLNRVFHLRRRQRDSDSAYRRIWRWSRTTAWRRVKAVMLRAAIFGLPASPKGLRHGFGVHAVQSGVPLPLLQRWMGHASMKTTAIYLEVIGPEEREFAERMWSSNTHADSVLRSGPFPQA
jgi:integrase/recombinase XerD